MTAQQFARSFLRRRATSSTVGVCWGDTASVEHFSADIDAAEEVILEISPPFSDANRGIREVGRDVLVEFRPARETANRPALHFARYAGAVSEGARSYVGVTKRSFNRLSTRVNLFATRIRPAVVAQTC